jgi:hepatocyte growth factor-regulated tyrosine kinase substrate
MNEKLSQAARLYDHLLTAQVSSPTLYNSTPALGRPYQTPSFQHTASSSAQYSYPQTLLQYPPSRETGTPRQELHVPGLSPQTYSNTNDYISSTEQLRSLALRETPPVQTYHPPSHPPSQVTAGDFTSSMSSPHIPLRLSSPPIVSHQQAPANPAPHSFPIFPSVPTAPLPSPAYRAPVEQKEAMLISFD